MRASTPEAIVAVIRVVLKNHLDVKVAILYGSVARGQMGEHSDVDIAVGAGRPLDWEAKQALQQDLSEALAREVDLIDLETLEGLLWETLWQDAQFLLWDHDLVVKYAGKVQAFHEDVKPGLMRMIKARLAKAFGV